MNQEEMKSNPPNGMAAILPTCQLKIIFKLKFVLLWKAPFKVSLTCTYLALIMIITFIWLQSNNKTILGSQLSLGFHSKCRSFSKPNTQSNSFFLNLVWMCWAGKEKERKHISFLRLMTVFFFCWKQSPKLKCFLSDPQYVKLYLM